MTLARATPFLVLLLLVAGITLFYVRYEDGTESVLPGQAERGAGPLVSLVPMLRTLAERPTATEDAVVAVGRAMEMIGSDPRPIVLSALAHDEWPAQWAGLLAIPHYGQGDADLARALLPLLASDQALVRTSAAQGAAYLAQAEFLLVREALVGLLEDRAVGPRSAALGTLGRRAARLPGLIPAFTRALADPDPSCRGRAARALAQIELQERLSPEELTPVRDALIAALGDARAEVRIYAVMALGRTGPAGAPAVPLLLPLLKDPDPLLRGQAATALGSIGPAALPALEQVLAAETGPGAPSLLWALRLMGEAGRPTLRTTLDHPSALVRVLAAQQLWELKEGVPRSVALLLKEAQGEDVEVQLVSIRVLGRMGTEGASALAVLRRLSEHPEPRVATAAVAAAERLRSVLGND